MKTIGIDIGTTTISLVVLDTEKKMVLESRTISNGTFIETGNDWERIQEPVKIIEKAVGVLNELLAAHKDVETIGLTGQMHGIVYLDNEGECVSPLYTWQDGRGAQPVFPACAGRGQDRCACDDRKRICRTSGERTADDPEGTDQ